MVGSAPGGQKTRVKVKKLASETAINRDIVTMYTKAAWNPTRAAAGGGRLRYENNTRRISGGGNGTTNNRMEIMAAIQALEALPKPSQVKLQSDATYVIKGALLQKSY